MSETKLYMGRIYKSPIFYMGNKFDLLPALKRLFPNNIDTFYDIFGGSGCVSGNANANKIIYNEINENIVNLYKLFLSYSPNEINDRILEYIEDFDLNTEGTNVRQNVEEIKEIRELYNKNYLKFREAYNNSERDYLMLYALTFYSFSNLIRFNSDNRFNMPYGNRCYTSKHYKQIKDWCNLIKNKNIEISQKDAFDLLNTIKFKENDFVYCDPPYSLTTAIYNEKHAFGGWEIEDDYKLFNILEKLNSQGIKWGMSNVFVNKELENTHLIEWCNKNNWYVHHLKKDYVSLGKGNANSDEVYICNYEVNDKLIWKTKKLF